MGRAWRGVGSRDVVLKIFDEKIIIHFWTFCPEVLKEDLDMKKIYITEEERVKCRKVMEAFSEMYEEQDVLVVDAGNYGFIKLQWFDERRGF